MILQHFSVQQILPLVISSVILITSIWFFQTEKKKISLGLLFIGSLGLGYFIANLDPFLMLWDEQYHALVAKNLTKNPFKPMLYTNPILDYDYRNWTENHIWLHKQPLFLWQIALSLKIFGYNALAVRFPSMLLHAIIPLFIYRIGKISSSDKIGYYGALFFAVAYFPLELVAGRYSTDHNDVSFLFYVIASFWAWFEYQNTKKFYWLIAIGLFSGCAVLVKWLVGLLIYAIWFISIGSDNKKAWLNLSSYLPILKSFLISLIIFIPWQIYIHYQFSEEASYEIALNTTHFFKTVEEHHGDYWFHFKAFKTIYGSGLLIPFLYLFGLIVFVRKCLVKTYQIAIISTVVIIYVFYSLAATKMISFTIIASPFAFLGLGALTDLIFSYLKPKITANTFNLILQSSLLLFVSIFLINISRIANYHTMWKPNDNFNRKDEMAQMALIKKLDQQLGSDTCVIFNGDIRLNGHIAIMFYTNHIAYNFTPNKQQITKIKDGSNQIIIVATENLPDFIKNDSTIIVLKE